MTTDKIRQARREPAKLRHESKHQISLPEDLVLTKRLEKILERDSHAGKDGTYRVTSLYFDTPEDRALREKTEGVNRREKFRLRYYGTDTGWIRLEKKYKVNGLCGKQSAPISAAQVRRLLKGEYRFLYESDLPLFLEFYSKLTGQGLRPKTIVCYDREAFLYRPGNVRITLDRRVRTGLRRTDFLNPDAAFVEALDRVTVLEVKYDEFLPETVRMAVQVPGRQAGACSKYVLCRRFD